MCDVGAAHIAVIQRSRVQLPPGVIRGATSIKIMLIASLAQMVEHLLCKVGLAEGTGFDPQRRQAFLSIFEILKRIC